MKHSCHHLIVTKQSLYGRNVNCEISSDEKMSEQASRSVAQNFKLLSELTETFVASWCATAVDRSIQCSAVFDFVICWKAFLTGEYKGSWETSQGSGGTSQSLRATHLSADGKTTHTHIWQCKIHTGRHHGASPWFWMEHRFKLLLAKLTRNTWNGMHLNTTEEEIFSRTRRSCSVHPNYQPSSMDIKSSFFRLKFSFSVP